MRQKLTQLAEHVWLWPHSSSFNAVLSSVGVIVGKNETVLVDAGNGPQLARRIQCPRPVYLTVIQPVSAE
jgi:hypothetical protein